MTCKEVEIWLLSTKAASDLPARVERHLEACPGCRQQRQQLAALDRHAHRLPVPPPSPGARQRLLERVSQTEQVGSEIDIPTLPTETTWSKGLRYAGYAMAACVLFGVGLFSGRQVGAPEPERVAKTGAEKDKKDPKAEVELPGAHAAAKKSEASPTVYPRDVQPRPDVTAKLFAINVQLARATSEPERFTGLGQFAAALREAADDLVRQGRPDELPAVVEAYERVLRDGVVALAWSLPQDRRVAATASLRSELQRPMPPSHEQLPLVRYHLNAIDEANAETIKLLTADDAPASRQTSPMRHPLVLLAVYAARQANETRLLARAELSAELALEMSRTAVYRAAGAQAKEATLLAGHVAELMDAGVVRQIERAAEKNEIDAECLNRVRGTASDVRQMLNDNLRAARAPNAELATALDRIDAALKRVTAPG